MSPRVRDEGMEWFFLIVQIIFVVTAIFGLALISVPLAVFALGVAGTWAMQRSLIALDVRRAARQQRT